MLDSLTKTPDKTPRVLIDKGAPVKPEGEKDETAQAASVLGKKGGEAAAAKRKAEAKAKPAEKEAKPAAVKDGDAEATPEKAKPAEAADEDATAAEKKGNPRHDPEARVEKLKADIAELARQKRELRDAIEAEKTSARRPAVPEPAREERRDAKPAAQSEASSHEDPSDPKPELSKYDGENAYERFVEDTSRWAARDENRKVQHAKANEDGHREWVNTVQTHVDTFHERVTGLKKGDAGQTAAFNEFMSTLPDAILAPSSVQLIAHAARTNQPHLRPGPENLITDLILKSEKPREIFEYFADDVNDYQRIAALRDPLQIAGEMAILSHRLDAVTADTSSEREVSKAGSPGKSVPGSPRAAEPNLTGDMNLDEFIRRKKSARK